jgi:hypothetical protein
VLLAHWIIAWLFHVMRHLWRSIRRSESTPRRYGRRNKTISSPVRTRSKPAWVREEIIALAARGATLSCRKLAGTFNRRHVATGMTVGHDFVWRTLRNRQADIQLQRKLLKRRIYRPGKPNHAGAWRAPARPTNLANSTSCLASSTTVPVAASC